jgi:hypothetical protein
MPAGSRSSRRRRAGLSTSSATASTATSSTPVTITRSVGAVRRLVEAPELRARLGEAGRRAVVGRTWERLGDDLLEHYADARRSMPAPMPLGLRHGAPQRPRGLSTSN